MKHIITILEDTFTGATARVHLDSQVSEEIPILRGMRQGDPVSPKLFTATIQEVFKTAQLEEKGINIDGEKLSNLTFADDVALTTEDVKDMEHQLITVKEESLTIALKIHKGQTKFMTNIDTIDNIQINGIEIEKVTNNRNGKQHKRRSFNQNKSRMECFWKAQTNFPRQAPSYVSKRKVFNQCVLPAMTYG